MKKWLALLLTLVLIVGLGACASSGDASSPAAQTPSGDAPAASADDNVDDTPAAPASADAIHVYEATDRDTTTDKHVDAYMAETGAEVVTHYIANSDYDDKIKVMIAGQADDIDVFWLRAPSLVKQYMGNNALENLKPFADASGVDLGPIDTTSLVGAKDNDGNFYGLPTSGSAWMLFYNKDLFDQFEIDYPIDLTWNEYLDLAAQLTFEEEGTKYTGGLIPPWTMNLGASSGGEYLTDDEPLSLTRQYSEVLYRAYTGDKSHLSMAEMKMGTFDANSFFGAGNIFMMVNGDWTFRLLETDFEYAAAPIPVFEGVEKGSTVGQSSYLCIPSYSTRKQAAYDYIEFACTSDTGTSIMAETDVPSYATEAALAKYKESITVDGVDYRFAAKVGDEQGTHEEYQAINEAFKEELELYLLDEQDLDTYMSEFFKRRAEILG